MAAGLAQDSGWDVVAGGHDGCFFDAFSGFVTIEWPVVISILWKKHRFIGVSFFRLFVLGLPLI